jgi:hypothetical protein
VFVMGSLAVTYFRTREVHYHRRGFVSRSCSGWEGVGPKVLWPPSVTCSLDAIGVERKMGRRFVIGCDCLSSMLLLKVIGSSLTGN